MTTWTALLDELTACEKATASIKLQAEKNVKYAGDKVKMVGARLQEIEQKQAQVIADTKAQFEHQVKDTRAKADRECAIASEAQKAAEAKSAGDQAQAAELDKRAKMLEKHVKQLNLLLERCDADCDSRRDAARQAADLAVSRKLNDSNNFILSTSIYASDVQDSALAAVENMQADHVAHLNATDASSLSRSHFGELRNMAKCRNDREVSDPGFDGSRKDCLHRWHTEWVSSNSVSPRAYKGRDCGKVSVLAKAPWQSIEDMREAVRASRTMPDSPRSKDRGRTRASGNTMSPGMSASGKCFVPGPINNDRETTWKNFESGPMRSVF